MTDNQFNQLFDLLTVFLNETEIIKADVAEIKTHLAHIKADFSHIKADFAEMLEKSAV